MLYAVTNNGWRGRAAKRLRDDFWRHALLAISMLFGRYKKLEDATTTPSPQLFHKLPAAVLAVGASLPPFCCCLGDVPLSSEATIKAWREEEEWESGKGN